MLSTGTVTGFKCANGKCVEGGTDGSRMCDGTSDCAGPDSCYSHLRALALDRTDRTSWAVASSACCPTAAAASSAPTASASTRPVRRRKIQLPQTAAHLHTRRPAALGPFGRAAPAARRPASTTRSPGRGPAANRRVRRGGQLHRRLRRDGLWLPVLTRDHAPGPPSPGPPSPGPPACRAFQRRRAACPGASRTVRTGGTRTSLGRAVRTVYHGTSGGFQCNTSADDTTGWFCPDGTCVPGKHVCDGKSDCAGGADEMGCVLSSCSPTRPLQPLPAASAAYAAPAAPAASTVSAAPAPLPPAGAASSAMSSNQTER
eukprot:scaffold41424_cov64-Phaeocystis_antarctica.AAC.1